ncbi:D-glycero-D-manno-heptose 1-phosphate guanosyltransferase [Candidatus Marinamargulisbacteria bacterium SCGC AAA071-K20]|nr:D-glycero-D-manno-heptose 1-phosphate guanosyltransferase [Candidatus Marinamargulisbacteria bacterium SCGC AAA071-K20]
MTTAKAPTDILILCGGLGTRLQSVVSDVPKSLALINNTPFLKILLNKYSQQGYKRFILCTGYMHDAYDSFIKTVPELDVVLSKEDTPLGTGGAIVNALSLVSSENVIVVNGDTFLDCHLNCLEMLHTSNKADLTFCLTKVNDASRYGAVDITATNKVIGFKEKDPVSKPGLINTGCYVLRTSVFSKFNLKKFSFESDFIAKNINNLNLMAYKAGECLFIDIGIPESYESAQTLLKEFT